MLSSDGSELIKDWKTHGRASSSAASLPQSARLADHLDSRGHTPQTLRMLCKKKFLWDSGGPALGERST